MSEVGRKSRRHFTEAARRAAVLARRAKLDQPRCFGAPELYVVRHPESEHAFAWQIRRFGGVVLAMGDAGFATSSAAREAGRRALESLEAR